MTDADASQTQDRSVGKSRRAFVKDVAVFTGVAGVGLLAPTYGLAANGTLRIGVDFPLTGLAAAWQNLLPNAKVARDEINAAGGILGRQIEFSTEDNQSSPSKDPLIMTKFASEKIDYVLGPPGSSPILSSLAVSTPNKMLQSGWGNDVAFGDGSKYPYFYQVVYNTAQEAELYVKYLVQTLGKKRIAILQENSAFGSAGTDSAKPLIKKLGAILVDVEVFPQSATDLQVAVGKAKQAGAEALIMFAAPFPTITTVMRAFAALHWTPPTAGHNLLFPQLLDILPHDSADNFFTISYKNLTYTDNTPVPARQAAFAKKLGAYSEIKKVGPALVIQAPHYDWLYLLKESIEAVKTFDIEAVRQQLNRTTGFNGMLGTMSFTSTKHTGVSDDSLTLGTLGSVNAKGSQEGFFLKRAPGL